MIAIIGTVTQRCQAGLMLFLHLNQKPLEAVFPAVDGVSGARVSGCFMLAGEKDRVKTDIPGKEYHEMGMPITRTTN